MKKIAIVTGASFGIGKATCRALSSDGFHVIAVARSTDEIEDLALGDPNIESYTLDITDEDAVSQFVSYLGDKDVSVLVNNAGGGATNLPIINDSLDRWRYAYELNVLAPVNLTRLLVPSMIKNEDGHVVFITSTCGHYVYRGGSGYTVAKHAEVALSELLRMEMLYQNVRVTEIAPGNVNSRNQGDAENRLTPEDVAEAVRWSVSMPKHVNVESIKLLHINNSIR